jgi:hypothetical protein
MPDSDIKCDSIYEREYCTALLSLCGLTDPTVSCAIAYIANRHLQIRPAHTPSNEPGFPSMSIATPAEVNDGLIRNSLIAKEKKLLVNQSDPNKP